MSSATFALAVNATIACLFAGTFLAIGLTNPSSRRVIWFGLAYAIGAGTPISELLVRYSPFPDLFAATSSITFMLAFLVTAAALAAFYYRRVPWLLLTVTFLASFALRAAIWGGPRNTLPYELSYQLPFAAGTFICAALILTTRPRQALDTALGVMFVVASAHFLVKPFLAVVFDSGTTARDYVTSVYALFSQSGTGILLVAIGLLLLLIVVRRMLDEAQQVSEIDTLSGLLNRRGFTRHAEAAIARAAATRRDISLLMLDLDHFKQINDTYGHAEGDRVIAAFSDMIRQCCPPWATIARMGGEEFAILLENTNLAVARLIGETIRAHLGYRGLNAAAQMKVTVSIGLAASTAPLLLSDLVQRADDALYQAKRSGRDRLCAAAASSYEAAGAEAGEARL